MLSLVFVSLLMACLQFALYFVAALQMRSALAETVAYASAFSTTTFYTDARDPAKIREAICKDLILADQCTTKLKLEQMTLKSLPTASQPITGTQFVTGVPGDVLVRRAEVPILTFVPGMQGLTIRSSSIWLRR